MWKFINFKIQQLSDFKKIFPLAEVINAWLDTVTIHLIEKQADDSGCWGFMKAATEV